MRVRKLKTRRLPKIVLTAAAIIAAGAAYYYLRIAPVITDVVTESTRMRVSESIDDMTEKQLYEVSYDDLVISRYDSDGEVVFVQINSVNVNLFARRVTSLIRGEMETFEQVGVDIPIGTATGIPLLSDLGPAITLNVLNLGVVDAEFHSEFTSAGINQTLHRLYMKVVVNMKIVLPGYSLAFDNSSWVIICENILSGDVPLGQIDIGSELVP